MNKHFMGDYIIEISNVSKSYTLAHEGKEKYTTLREEITRKAKSFGAFRKPKANPELSSTEEFWALNDVSFNLKQGDRVGILGRNGAGKSTLLKVLSRITEPTRGTIRIRGRVASLLEVGTGFHPELTGRENIFLNGAILGMSRNDVRKKFDEIVEFSEVEKFLDTPVKRYSSGMYVRLAFAVAAHLEPEILIVDEVLAVGDAQFQRKCLGKMEDVSKGEGRTLLFVSHNMASIQKLCNDAVLMEKGQVLFHGGTQEAVTMYLNKNRQGEGNWGHRHGNGHVKLLAIGLESNEGRARNEFIMGEDVYFRLRIQFERDVQHLDIGMNFKNLMDETITHITNLDSGYELSGREGEVKDILVKATNIWFTPGQYNIDIGIVGQDKEFDIIENVADFQMIQSKDIHRPGIFPSHVKVFTKSIWEAS
ncbi:ABC transporter ATP-binding protein [Flavihumibacter rivuli]|uniref:ABC transporter ATP-binding protein n=1 Tax=Flavihumibacter rivuli TaxID=2838156 RepID=UPI001BDE39F5|nr:ABC transporter ATP-binding protein [Flavihumibacter rivuli]ULQ56250.1 ABC transporter ATP-binding protein [Flavihumibacter rivuli]